MNDMLAMNQRWETMRRLHQTGEKRSLFYQLISDIRYESAWKKTERKKGKIGATKTAILMITKIG